MYTHKKGFSVSGIVNRRAELASLTLVATLVGCSTIQAQTTPTPTPAIDTIKVYFSGNCPVAVDDFVVSANKGDQIQWQAVDQSGANTDDQFKVYFDPFQGATISTNPQGTTTPVKTVDNSVPANVLYKYTILGDSCTNQPLDPFLRVL